jgi:predicted dehydrogenase
MLIEKPLCTPALENVDALIKLVRTKNCKVLVGYNHVLTDNTIEAVKLLRSLDLKKPLTMTAHFREHWKGIFGAHPWLRGPQDTYLGYTSRGGGASGEHSHAINIWQFFAHELGLGRITEVSAMMDIVDDGKVRYDQICQINVRTEKGFVGNIIQDVVTEPSQKRVLIQTEAGQLEWQVNAAKDKDAVRYSMIDGKSDEVLISKTRPDDFKGEIHHIDELLSGKASYESSPVSLERGLETMMVVAACGIAHQKNKTVSINYHKGFQLTSID